MLAQTPGLHPGYSLVASPAIDQIATGGFKDSNSYLQEAGAAAIGTIGGGMADKALGAAAAVVGTAAGTASRTAVSIAADTAAATAAQNAMPPRPL